MALSLAACGSSDDSTTEVATETTETETVTVTTPVVDAAKTIALTTTTDTATGGSGDDSISGVVQAQGGTGTTAFPGDRVDGGAGADTFTLTMAGAHTGAYSVAALDVDNVESYLVNNFETSTNNTTIDTSLNSGVTLYGLVASHANGDTIFSNVTTVTDIEVRNGAGDMTMTYLATGVAGAADVQNVTVSNLTAGTISADGAETIAVTSELVKSTVANFASTSLTKLTVVGDQNLTISNAVDFVAGTSGDTTIDATTDASAFTGNLTFTADANDHSFTGGSGNDTINMVATLTLTDHIDGGAGADTLSLNQAALTTQFTNVKNVETVKFNANDSSTALVAYDFSKLSAGAETISIDVNDNNGANNHDSISNQTTQSIVVRNSADDAANGNTKVVIGNKTDTAADTISVTLMETVEGSDKTDIDSLSVANYETVNLVSSREATTTTAQHNNVDAVVAGSATTMNVSGDQQLTLAGITGGAMTTFDASGLANKLSATFSSTDKVTATMAQKDTTLIFGATLDNNDTVIGGAGTKDNVTATLTGATATTSALNISGVETVTLATTGNNTLALGGVTGASNIGITANTQTITGYDLGATLFATDSPIVTLTPADSSGTNDTLTYEVRMDANGNETVTINEATTAGGIENLAFVLNDQEATAVNGLTATLTKFYGSNITVTQKATTATDSLKNSNFDLGTVHKNVTTVDSTGTKGTQAVNASNATQSLTFDVSGTGAATLTGGAYADTVNIASTTAAHTVTGNGGADVVNMTTAGATDVSGINAETVNITVAAGTDIDVSGGTFHSGVDNVVLTGGNSLSTFTTGTIHTNVKSVDASGMGGNSVMTLGDDTADNTVTLSANSLITDTLAFQLSGTNFAATISGIETITGNIDGDDTINLASASGVTLVSLDIADGKTATVSNVVSETVRVTDGNATGQVTVSLANALGAADAATIELKDGGTAIDAGFNIGTADIETVTVKASSAESVDLSTLTMTAASAVMALNATGTKALTVTATNADVTTIDASGMGNGGSFVQTGRSASTASTYTGSDGNDTFIQMTGSDAIDGGAGTGDTLDINFAAILGGLNVDLSATGDQVNTFNGMAETILQQNFENVDVVGYTGTFGAQLTGSTAANTIVGTNQIDQISGGAGGDTITSSGGNDVITLGSGADVVKIIDLTSGDGSDTISTFATGDKIDVDGVASFTGAVVNSTSSGAITLNSVAALAASGTTIGVADNKLIVVEVANKAAVDTIADIVTALANTGVMDAVDFAANADAVLVVGGADDDTTHFIYGIDNNGTAAIVSGELALLATVTTDITAGVNGLVVSNFVF
jgi:hypothetical protein